MARKKDDDGKPKRLDAERRRVLADELAKVERDDDGRLHPEAVVEAAANKRSPLHEEFTWDDAEAGHLYRIEQARTLIRVVVVRYEEDGIDRKLPVYINLVADRQFGGGYRPLDDVMRSADLTRQLVETAESELRGWMGRWEEMVPQLVRKVQRATNISIHPAKRKDGGDDLPLAMAGH